MIESVIRKLLVMKKFVDFINVLPNLSNIQRTKILEETLVYKILNV